MLFQGLQLNEEQKKRILKEAQKEFVSLTFEDENEQKKRDACPLYHLLYYPYIEYSVADNVSCTYIDRVLFSAIDVCKRRTGIALEEDPLVKRVLEHMYDVRIRDHKLKITALFFLMWIEPRVLEFFRSLYVPQSEELTHFNDIVPNILKNVSEICLQGYDVYTIKYKIKVVFFEKCLLKLYAE